MGNLSEINIENYNYTLPEERIAKYPLDERDLSKLLVYEKGEVSTDIFRHVNKYLNTNSLLVFNNTKVIQARLPFIKDTGAKIEIFCLEPVNPSDYAQAFSSKNTCTWKCLVGNSKKWKEGKLSSEFNLGSESYKIFAERIDKGETSIIEFSWNTNDLSFGEILELMGIIPIPPYLNRESEKSDLERYQTVYSHYKGSVAAPTAGLHFTDKLIEYIQTEGIDITEVTLHVGAGTFKPVSSEKISDHEMHSEFFRVSKSTIEQLLHNFERIVAVGTTSVRTIESLFLIGKQITSGLIPENGKFKVNQWDAYEKTSLKAKDSLKIILDYLNKTGQEYIDAETQIMIVPGYTFKYVNQLITNFHQPKSTLLLLISAFIGENWKKVYNYALEHNYRFLSYGDSSILIP